MLLPNVVREPMPGVVIVQLGVEVVSEANRASHEHWRARQKRAAEQREAVGIALCSLFPRGHSLSFPFAVHLTRIAPSELDDDNLAGAFKHVRDSVADWLGLPNDRDPRVKWKYSQRTDRPRTYGVEIRFAPHIPLRERVLRVLHAAKGAFLLGDAICVAQFPDVADRLVAVMEDA